MQLEEAIRKFLNLESDLHSLERWLDTLLDKALDHPLLDLDTIDNSCTFIICKTLYCSHYLL